MDEADHEAESDACGKGGGEAEGDGIEDDGVGDAHGGDGDHDDMAADEEDAEDEGEDKVEEEEPLDGKLEQDVEQDGQGPKEDACSGTMAKSEGGKGREGGGTEMRMGIFMSQGDMRVRNGQRPDGWERRGGGGGGGGEHRKNIPIYQESSWKVLSAMS